MAESTVAERLDYLLEMALTIHDGIVESLHGNDELDNQLVAHLKTVEHFIVMKKALQGPNSGSNNELAAVNTTPSPTDESPSTAKHVNEYSVSPQSHRSLPSPSLFFSSPEPQGTPTSTPARQKAPRRIPGETRNSRALRKMRHAVPYASWVDKPK
ncbi:hypothetical protein FANTH_2004 [Fusarium anthophilum]|uniref:Uncharacterized protein n=1 Tax=Fusarium anthophilum TaxID=48485 RepID=A0A8H4ZUJ1_9HYPO|nr:hypothetical protein FANTH_2004 [Fusarium anthophilum]